MAPKEFTPNDILKIINACKDAGIHELSFNDLKIKFTTSSDTNFTTIPEMHPLNKAAESFVKMSEKPGLMDSEFLKDQMIIHDPEAFENGHFQVDGGNAEENNI